MEKETRVAVGHPDGKRSTVWKFSVYGSEVYIFTRMFGSHSKVSLHSSGECQWSATDHWVKASPERRNADRHVTRWKVDWPDGSGAVHAFTVRIPSSELREVAASENLAEVHWLSPPGAGQMLSLECYVTPVSEADPAIGARLPHKLLISMPLRNGRWFVVLHHISDLPPDNNLELMRSRIWADAAAAGVAADPKQRGTAFFVTDTTARGLMELCPPVSA